MSTPAPHLPRRQDRAPGTAHTRRADRAETLDPLRTRKSPSTTEPRSHAGSGAPFHLPQSASNRPDTRVPPSPQSPTAPRPPAAAFLTHKAPPALSIPERSGNPNQTQQIGLTRPRIRPCATAENPAPDRTAAIRPAKKRGKRRAELVEKITNFALIKKFQL